MPPPSSDAGGAGSEAPTPRAVWGEAVSRYRLRQSREQADIDDAKTAHQHRVAVLAEARAPSRCEPSGPRSADRTAPSVSRPRHVPHHIHPHHARRRPRRRRAPKLAPCSDTPQVVKELQAGADATGAADAAAELEDAQKELHLPLSAGWARSPQPFSHHSIHCAMIFSPQLARPPHSRRRAAWDARRVHGEAGCGAPAEYDPGASRVRGAAGARTQRVPTHSLTPPASYRRRPSTCHSMRRARTRPPTLTTTVRPALRAVWCCAARRRTNHPVRMLI